MLFNKTKVRMILSVGSHEAGRSYRLPPGLADQYIIKGYAEGELSRPYTKDERNLMKGPTQTITL